MRVLITGVAGHLGSAFAKWLLTKEPAVRIHGIDNLSSGFRENVPAGVELLEQDVGDVVACRPTALFAEPFDYVFHFAAFAAECLSPFVRTYTIDNVWRNTSALISQVIASGGCRRFVLASSIAVYGHNRKCASGTCRPRPFNELDIPRPNDPYGIAKLACEHDLRVAGEQHGLPWCILRPHNIYGPGQNLWDRHRNVFGIWMRQALEGKPLAIFGDGHQQRAFSYIDDILPAIWRAAEAPAASKQVINLGGSQPISILDAAAATACVVKATAIEHLPARHEVRDAWCTTNRSEQLLGYRDRTPLANGLAKMWAWARDAWQQFPERRHRREPFEIELREGMPPSWQGVRA